jgi:hypothetical protein
MNANETPALGSAPAGGPFKPDSAGLSEIRRKLEMGVSNIV